MTEAPPIVFVVDDEPSVRRAIKRLVESEGLRVELFGSAPEFLQGRRPDAPSCLVLDIKLPGITGLDFQHQLSEAGVRIPIIFITGHGDIPMTVRAMKAGAVEFLTKPFLGENLLDAIQVALERDRTRRQQESEIAVLKERFDSLTPRETQIFRLVVTGRPNKKNAADLGTSEITIKVHRASVMRKMQAESLADLVRMAGRLRLPVGQRSSNHTSPSAQTG